MRLTTRPVLERCLRRLQQAYARALRSGAARVPREDARGPPGGSLPDAVERRDLLSFSGTGASFVPSRLGVKFRAWWLGTTHQAARGQDLSVDEEALVRELEDDLARQVEDEDRRTL